MVRPRFVCLALMLVTLLLYAPVRRHQFILYDDPDYVTENRPVQAGLTWEGVKWAFTTWHANNWHPVTWLSHMLDCELFGLDAGPHHLVNVLFHTANAALLLLVLWRLTGALWPSALVAALFAWHPTRVESVAWAAERKDVLSACFFLATLWAYVLYAQARRAAAPRSDRSVDPVKLDRAAGAWRFYVLAVLFLALGLMSKPMLVTTPFVLLLLDYWPLGRFLNPRPAPALRPRAKVAPRRSEPRIPAVVMEKLPLFALCAASCVMTILAQRSEAVVDLEPYPIPLRLANAVAAYGGYLLKTVWPARLSVVYPLQLHVPPWKVAASAVALVAISYFAWRERKVRPHLLVGWLWFLGMLAPVIGLVQVGGQAMADRYLYLPQIGLFLAAVFEARFWAQKLKLPVAAAAAAAALILMGCVAASARQLQYWQDTETLFTHAIAVTSNNAVALVNLGLALHNQGRYEEALAKFQAAVAADGNLAQAHNNLANLLERMGRTSEALEHYQIAVRLKPKAPLAHDNLGTLLVKLGKIEDGESQYKEAILLDPTDPRPHYLMAKALWRQGRDAQALDEFQDALRLDDKDVPSLVYCARMLASNPYPPARNGSRALELARKANELTGGKEWLVLDTCAMAYAEVGRFDLAQEMARQALEQCQAAHNQAARAGVEQRLRLYQSGQPFRSAVPE